MIRYILASRSPRRRELLGQAGLTFDIIPAEGEEAVVSEDPAKTVRALARSKAEEIADGIENGDIVLPERAGTEKADRLVIIGSDTVVAIDDEILGKPRDWAHAYAMIHALQDRTHHVYTGVSVICLDHRGQETVRTEHTFHECTEVHVLPMDEEEIRSYIDSSEPYDKAGVSILNHEWEDKAGAYAIQGKFGARYVSGIVGDYNNVVGLPICRLYNELKRMKLLNE